MSETIKIENCGPIKALEVTLGDPGVYVVRGPNGCGKTTLLDTLDVVTNSGDRKPTKREGAAVGKVEALGVILRLGQKVTRGGKLVIQSVEGQNALGVLIDPQIKDPVAADKRRIEALVAMCGAKAGRELFLDLDPEADDLLPAMPTGCELTTYANSARAFLHEAALQAEKDAVRQEANASAAEAAGKGVDLKLADVDPNDLAEQLTLCQKRAAIIENQIAETAERKRKAEEARKRLAIIDGGISEDQATERLRIARENLGSLQAVVQKEEGEIRDAQRRLDSAKHEASKAMSEVEGAQTLIVQVKRNAELRAACEAQIAEAAKEGPTQEQFNAEVLKVHEARRTIEAAAVARKAREQLEAAAEFLEAAETQDKRSKRLRKAAWSVDKVLAAQIERLETPVEIKDGRMICRVPPGSDGREVFVHDLSYGQRAQLFGVPFCRALGKGGLGTVDQRTWEGLDGRGREQFAALVRSQGVYVLTAEAERDPEKCDEEIRVEQF